MKEKSIHQIWLEDLWKEKSLKTTDGHLIRVISPGSPNPDAGPDFFNALIRIGDITWAGNVEIHRKASDWLRHGHHLDRSYNNVILHLVLEHDALVRDQRGRGIPCLLLPAAYLHASYCSPEGSAMNPIRCLPACTAIKRDLWQHLLLKLYGERMKDKQNQLMDLDKSRGRSWENMLYLHLGRNFGLPINVLPFQMTLAGLPEKALLPLRDDPADLEALLFGQAGLLPQGKKHGPYVRELKKRFNNYRKIPQSPPLEEHLWKFLRLRPASFPTLRISQFAMLLHKRLPLLESLLDMKTPGEVESLIRISCSPYWYTHYRFGNASPGIEKNLGKQAIDSLMVNAITPFLLCFGRETNTRIALNLGESLMEQCRAESNRITRLWATGGIRARSAMESQGLIQLYKEYCKQKRCFDCLIGKRLYQPNAP